MKKLSIKRVRRFFDINGLDVLEGEKIEVSEVINGIEYCSLEEAYKVMSPFTPLFGGLVEFCKLKK
jgi:hypothetical protein